MKVAHSCPTLCHPMDYPGHETLQAGILERVVFPFSRGSSQPRIELPVIKLVPLLKFHFCSDHIAEWFFFLRDQLGFHLLSDISVLSSGWLKFFIIALYHLDSFGLVNTGLWYRQLRMGMFVISVRALSSTVPFRRHRKFIV